VRILAKSLVHRARITFFSASVGQLISIRRGERVESNFRVRGQYDLSLIAIVADVNTFRFWNGHNAVPVQAVFGIAYRPLKEAFPNLVTLPAAMLRDEAVMQNTALKYSNGQRKKRGGASGRASEAGNHNDDVPARERTSWRRGSRAA
jgi:hypothetical protein